MNAGDVALVTPVHGRHGHLMNQRQIVRQVAADVAHIVVAVDDPHVERLLHGDDLVTVVHEPGDPRGMPTARARNRGAAVAFAAGASHIVLLDVDCVPLPGFVDAMVAALRAGDTRVPGARNEVVANGLVTYLSQHQDVRGRRAGELSGWRNPHPARPHPGPGEVLIGDSHHLLWSLAVGVSASAWRALGGFCERYVGYGAEDTDLGALARAHHIPMAWVGGAHVLHQYHPTHNPPRHHLHDIVRNARIYRERWGTWPMEGWLSAFEADGLIVRDGPRISVSVPRATTAHPRRR